MQYQKERFSILQSIPEEDFKRIFGSKTCSDCTFWDKDKTEGWKMCFANDSPYYMKTTIKTMSCDKYKKGA